MKTRTSWRVKLEKVKEARIVNIPKKMEKNWEKEKCLFLNRLTSTL
jgi:hypothetical protein